MSLHRKGTPKSRQGLRQHREVGGFTLIELMVAVVIVALIAAIAYPAYRKTLLKSRRSDAKVSLMQFAQEFEQCYAQYGTYDPSKITACPPVESGTPKVSQDGYYTISVSNLGSGTYTLSATPTSKGGQDDDTTCSKFTINQTNDETASNTGGATTTSTCW